MGSVDPTYLDLLLLNRFLQSSNLYTVQRLMVAVGNSFKTSDEWIPSNGAVLVGP